MTVIPLRFPIRRLTQDYWAPTKFTPLVPWLRSKVLNAGPGPWRSKATAIDSLPLPQSHKDFWRSLENLHLNTPHQSMLDELNRQYSPVHGDFCLKRVKDRSDICLDLKSPLQAVSPIASILLAGLYMSGLPQPDLFDKTIWFPMVPSDVQNQMTVTQFGPKKPEQQVEVGVTICDRYTFCSAGSEVPIYMLCWISHHKA